MTTRTDRTFDAADPTSAAGTNNHTNGSAVGSDAVGVAGSGSSAADERRDAYRARNAALFARRFDVLDELAKPKVSKVKARRLRRELERVDTEIVEANQGLVGAQLKRWSNNAVDAHEADELRAVGNAGLWEAISTYNPDKGPFGQWGQLRIRSALLRAVRVMNHQTIGRSDFERRPRILSAAQQLEGTDLAGDPTEIARIAGVPVAAAERVIGSVRLLSLNKRYDDSDGGTAEYGDSFADEDLIDAHDHHDTAFSVEAVRRHGLGSLPPRELYVVTRFWGLDGEPAASLAVIGEALGVTREAARQTHNRALSRLTHPHTLHKMLNARRASLAGA